jgi:cephalosporin hydroxylase
MLSPVSQAGERSSTVPSHAAPGRLSRSILAHLLTEPSKFRHRLTRLRTGAINKGFAIWDRTGSRPVATLYHHDLIYKTGNFRSLEWLGVPIWQNPLDLWTIQEAISSVKPGLLVETGTDHGGSALFYANLMDLLGQGEVITIDIVRKHSLEHPRVRFLHGSSTDPEIVEQVRVAAAGTDGPVMVILDGNHDRDHVAAELELYAPLVTPGSLLLSQDGVIDRFRIFSDSRPGPLEANRNFLSQHPEFEHDRKLNEQFRLTQHPLGWMRRRPERAH